MGIRSNNFNIENSVDKKKAVGSAVWGRVLVSFWFGMNISQMLSIKRRWGGTLFGVACWCHFVVGYEVLLALLGSLGCNKLSARNLYILSKKISPYLTQHNLVLDGGGSGHGW